MRLALIVAMTRDGLMGRANALPWHWPADLRHFQRTTKGHAVVMGRRTFESLLENFGGPLRDRENLVISRSAGGGADGELRDGARWFSSLPSALAWLDRRPAADTGRADTGRAGTGRADAGRADAGDEAFLLGGAEIFRLALQRDEPLPDRLVVTWVPEVPHEPGDTFFPFRPPEPWILQRFEAEQRWTDGPLEFVVYGRRPR